MKYIDRYIKPHIISIRLKSRQKSYLNHSLECVSNLGTPCLSVLLRSIGFKKYLPNAHNT